ncbi:hypothetical protein L6452_43869 [Arctium lappa]|uniref:Uncharacterized protein n=1 Tax=Arctium lappa TaxID=4217 RepID=A0ACB8XI36_ARCLA|nr:hypothetical protein L6452_43869 [Arctium lappa]
MQPAMWTIRTVLEDFDLQYVYEHGIEQPSVQEPSNQEPPIQEPSVQEQSVQGDDREDSDYMEEEMIEVGVDMKNFRSIIDWNLEWLGNKEQLVEDQKLGKDDPLELEVAAFYSGDESDIKGERKQNLRKLRKEHANDGGNKVFRSKAKALDKMQGTYTAQYRKDMVWCHHCAKNSETHRDYTTGNVCCVDCGKVVSQDIYTEDATFVKDSAGGQAHLAGNLVRMENACSESHRRTLEKGNVVMIVKYGISNVSHATKYYQIAVERGFTKGRRTGQVAAANCLHVACSSVVLTSVDETDTLSDIDDVEKRSDDGDTKGKESGKKHNESSNDVGEEEDLDYDDGETEWNYDNEQEMNGYGYDDEYDHNIIICFFVFLL